MSISKLCLKLQVARGDVINFYIQNESKPLNTLNKALDFLIFVLVSTIFNKGGSIMFFVLNQVYRS